MRSKYADHFNHDWEASGYDIDVQDGANPIREGYDQVLQWVAKKAIVDSQSVLLDLGVGTGNLSRLILDCAELVCVDVSSRMMEIAKAKLKHVGSVSYINSDLLEFFDGLSTRFDAVISTYTIHHLTEDEKALLFGKIWQHLIPGGRAVFGDLMFESESDKLALIKKYQNFPDPDVVEAMQEEFFWCIDIAEERLIDLGFVVEIKRFSDLSWVISAVKPGS